MLISPMELLLKTVGVDPEVCVCGARMIVDNAITDGEKISETLARLGRRFARFNGSTKEAAIDGELDYVYDLEMLRFWRSLRGPAMRYTLKNFGELKHYGYQTSDIKLHKWPRQ